ncbi:hypothetical protein DX928_23645 [Bacillus swezeyi]|uniref:Uncharacterized protein n=2 Tax=Bacillus swezeyi TaxID=1925020 RepID=A0A5M8REK1_9BACI|nr:hypothetical protein DX927_23405 [Bacillus swezeyi]KAA6471583.1 hypothetical protein DX928_23645 [Bacillus swezeyi]
MVSLVLIAIFALFTLTPAEALAASDPWSKAGIKSGGSIENSGIYKDLDKIVFFIMAIGGFWILGCLVFAGIMLSGSQNNPQRRTAGFIGLAMTFLGGWVIMKAYDIAGWINGFGS